MFENEGNSMFVRVCDKKHGCYYKSIVYGKIDIGYFEKYVVLNPFTDSFEAVDYLAKDEEPFTGRTQINIINAEKEEWKRFYDEELLKLSRSLDGYDAPNKTPAFYGYEDVYQKREYLLRLLKSGPVPRGEFRAAVRSLPGEGHWNYIKTQADAGEFMQLFAGFHDSTLKSLWYKENDNKKDLHMVFENTGWYGMAELFFEGLVEMRIRPPEDNMLREFLSGCLLIHDECVFWADEDLCEENLSHNGSYVKAYNLKWRKIGK